MIICNLKAFSPSKISYLKCYVYDLYTNISVVVGMPPIMVGSSVILKFEFVNIKAFHIFLAKRWIFWQQKVMTSNLK